MKNLIKTIFTTCLITLTLHSCEAQKVVVNREVDTKTDGKMLLGPQTEDQFTKEPYSNWYNDEFANYQLDEKAIDELRKEKLNTYQLIVFIGTWCEDSHREFPRLMKILETLKYPTDKLTIIAVNRKKESPSGEEGLHNIQKVPTIIVKKYGKEFGRIIEFPKTGFIEKDLLEIVKKNDTSVSDLFKK